MSINIIERAITPYNEPMNRLVQRERYNLFVPMAGLNSIGMAGYAPTDFAVINGIVYIANGSITADKLASNSVITSKLANNSVTTDKLQYSSITTEKIVDEAVTTGKLNDGSVITSKLASNSVTTDKLNDGSITTEKIVDEAVTTGKLNDGSVTTEKLADNAVTPEKLSNVWTAEQQSAIIKTLGVDTYVSTYVQQFFDNIPEAEESDF